jgi:hypothetical protein
MPETLTGYTFLRDNYATVDLLPFSVTTCTPGDEATPAVAFAAWLPLHDFAVFMVERCPDYRGGYWPNKLERGYRLVSLSFVVDRDTPDDVTNTVLDLSTWPDDRGMVGVIRADVVDELTAADIYDVVPPQSQTVNYYHARDSMQELMG